MNVKIPAVVSTLLFASSLAFAAPAPRWLYVAPDGCDTADGSRAHPLATPSGARDAVRRLLADPAFAAAGIVVTFADGTYRLAEPLKLDARDSGRAGCPVLYRAAHVGKAVFTGAPALEWKPVAKDDFIRELLPAAARGHVLCADLPGEGALPDFEVGVSDLTRNAGKQPQLSVYSGQNRLELASWPAGDEWGRLTDMLGPKRGGGWQYDTGVVRLRRDSDGAAPDLAALAKEPSLYVDGIWHHGWRHCCTSVRKVDAAGGWIVLSPEASRDTFSQGAYGRVKNAFSQIDAPGKWAVCCARRHRLSRRLVYVWPRAGEAPDVALAMGLVRLERADSVGFEGFVFTCSRDTHVVAKDCRNVEIVACEIRHGSTWGVRIDGGENCRVAGCDIHDLGSGGVSASGGCHATLRKANHAVDNCHIWDYAKSVFFYQPGVTVGGVGCRVTHNLIHHSRHMGLGFSGNDHYVGYNILHDLCRETDDAGAIYAFQTDNTYALRGTVVEYNVVHATGRANRTYETEAIYFDGYLTGCTARGNIVNRASTGVFLQGGHDSLAEKNVILNCTTAIDRRNLGRGDDGSVRHEWTHPLAESPLLQPQVKNRELYSSDYWKRRHPTVLRALEIAERGDAAFAQSSLFTTIASNVLVATGPISIEDEKTTKPAVAGNARFESDPGFIDYAGMNWELRDDSPARKTLGGGTRFGEMGLYASAERFSPAVKFGPGVTPAAPLARERLAARTRLAVVFDGEMPEGTDSFAADLVRCSPGPSNRGVRARTLWSALGCEYVWHPAWRDFEFSFTPRFSGKARLILWGEWGEKTLYRDFRAEGAALADDWKADDWCPAYVMENADTRPALPASGRAGANIAANATETAVATLTLTKDRPVTIRFQSRTDTMTK